MTLSPSDRASAVCDLPLTSRLLVSVRDADELHLAVDGGCRIVDVKQPFRGSLGMADPSVLQAIADAAGNLREPVLLSAALGELQEWPAERTIAPLAVGYRLVKLGLAGQRDRADWQQRWRAVRARLDADWGPRGWVAVVYGDAAAEAPCAEAVIEHAVAESCAGVLFDTCVKDGRSLLDHVTLSALDGWCDQIRSTGMFAAVAGSLRLEQLELLRDRPIDIIAVRGAACREADRTQPLDRARIQQLAERV